jgi:hypothetical protein
MEKQTLQKLIEQGYSQRRMAQVLSISVRRVKKILFDFGLTTKCRRGQFAIKEFRCECGETNKKEFPKKGGGRRSLSVCRKCHNKKIMHRLYQVKIKSVYYKGGGCQRCGYNKNLSALQFHHRNPNEKSHSYYSTKRNWEKFKKELDGCDLLCANCHAEVTWGNAYNPFVVGERK